jgi:Cu+-exporting ATPase
MRTFALAILIGLSSTVAACGGATPEGATPAASPSGVKAPGAAQIGDKTTCPVSGEEFTVSATSPKVELDGKTYYFCCESCVQKFQADPQKYLKHPAAG